ncbi:aminoglycoside phosphotransferase family protein [Moraxella oblonga]|uniref:aminoglycoside phosphotransferase family protein n=1 Tax=Moraxella oblonga TaxID=200413 RepID=UPI000830547F|nr:phosphotransferase [Moraxella oblonga]
MNRTDEMMTFLNTHLTQGFRVESLAGDASFRRYHRIFFHVGSEIGRDEMSYLLMDAPPQKESVVEFVKVAHILSEKVNVPDIIASDIERGFLLLQDFGTTEFAHLILDKNQKDKHYTTALHTLAQLQQIRTDVDLPPYDDDKLTAEMNLFSEWFLPYVNVQFDDLSLLLWQRLQKILLDNIQTQPKVIVHRDYHSRNLMADKSSDALGVIDFQDALIGADTYDLVSLVRDAYIDEDEVWVNQKIEEFYTLIHRKDDIHAFTKDVNIMGIQRHLKVLGIFVRLYQRDGKDRYLTNIPKVMNDLRIELAWLSEHGNNVVYGEFLAWLDKKVMPNYQQKFA